MKRHKVIGIARQVGAHGAALHLAGIDSISKLQSDLEHHIFFLGAIGADGTRVLAAVTRINGHHNQSVGDGRSLHRRLANGRGLPALSSGGCCIGGACVRIFVEPVT